jgi:hypothetical protein
MSAVGGSSLASIVAKYIVKKEAKAAQIDKN